MFFTNAYGFASSGRLWIPFTHVMVLLEAKHPGWERMLASATIRWRRSCGLDGAGPLKFGSFSLDLIFFLFLISMIRRLLLLYLACATLHFCSGLPLCACCTGGAGDAHAADFFHRFELCIQRWRGCCRQ